MSLLKRVREKKCPAAETPSGHSHIARAADRNVRNAYVNGLIFAAVANVDGDEIDDATLAPILEIGGLLGFSNPDIRAAVRAVFGIADEDKLDLLRECASCLTGEELAFKFCEEFTSIWNAGHGDEEELHVFMETISKHSGVNVNAVDRAIRDVLDELAEVAKSRGFGDFIEDRDGDPGAVEVEEPDGGQSVFVHDTSSGYGDDLEER